MVRTLRKDKGTRRRHLHRLENVFPSATSFHLFIIPLLITTCFYNPFVVLLINFSSAALFHYVSRAVINHSFDRSTRRSGGFRLNINQLQAKP